MKAFDPDVVVVSLFLAVVVGVYFWCFQILKAGKQHRYRFKAFEYPVLLSGLIGILCFVYGVVEPFRLETTTACGDPWSIGKPSWNSFGKQSVSLGVPPGSR